MAFPVVLVFPVGATDPDPLVWPTSAEHLTALLREDMWFDPDITNQGGNWTYATGSIGPGDIGVETLVIGPDGLLFGDPFYVNIAGTVLSPGDPAEEGTFTLRWEMQDGNDLGSPMVTTDIYG